jgi:hypothetical protein
VTHFLLLLVRIHCLNFHCSVLRAPAPCCLKSDLRALPLVVYNIWSAHHAGQAAMCVHKAACVVQSFDQASSSRVLSPALPSLPLHTKI